MHIPRFTIAGLVLVLGACPAPAVYQSAKPLAPGAWQVGGGIGGLRFQDEPQETDLPSADLEIFARRGIVENLDAGLRLYTFGAEASAKWRFWDGQWDLALMPGLALAQTGESSLTTKAVHAFASLPLLATRALSKDWSITVGPRLQGGLYKSEASDSSFGVTAGGLVMVAFEFASARLMPEFDLSRTISGDVPIDGWITHVGLGIAWDLQR